MPIQVREKVEKLAQTTSALGKVGLLIIESGQKLKKKLDEAESNLSALGYQKCADYLEIMDALSAGQDKIFYIEKREKLDGLVLEIIAEFEAGMVSLADRKHNTGLKTAQWNPIKTSFIVMMSRKQVEASYQRLFEYINFTQSL